MNGFVGMNLFDDIEEYPSSQSALRILNVSAAIKYTFSELKKSIIELQIDTVSRS